MSLNKMIKIKVVDNPVSWEATLITVLDDLIGIHDDGDEEGKDNIDEQAYEGVQVHPAVHPH